MITPSTATSTSPALPGERIFFKIREGVKTEHSNKSAGTNKSVSDYEVAAITEW